MTVTLEPDSQPLVVVIGLVQDRNAELADTQDTLDEKEKAELKRALDDIVRDTAKTPAAAERFKVLASKAGKGALN